MNLNLIDRLQLLNYDEELRAEIKMKPIGRYYFSVAGSSGEQFHAFTSVAAWLLRKLDRRVDQPQEDDDPNFTISTILDNMRELDIPVDFSPNKLKQGYGEFVTYVLDKLTERVLKSQNYEWKQIEIVPNDQNDNDDELEFNDGLHEDDQDVEEEHAELDEEIFSDDSEDGAYVNGAKMNEVDNDFEASNYDENAWLEEVEKVAPALKIRIAPSARDWRAHLQQMISYKEALVEKTDSLGTGLTRISANIVRILEATRAREQLLAAHVPPKLIQLKAEYEKTLSTFKVVNTGITQRQEILSDLVDKVESVKQKTESKGSAMNDTSPVVNIKKSLVMLKKEIQQMDLQLAVLMWTVVDKQSKVKKIMPMERIT